MRATLPAIGALLFSVALLLLGNGLQNTLLPMRAQLETFDPIEIGLLGSAFFLGFALGGFYGPAMVRRVGHIRAFTAMVATASAIVLVFPLAIDPTLWSLLRIGAGACFAILYIVIESWLNERAPSAARGAVFALYATISLVMIGCGQFLLTLAPVTEPPLFLLSSILLSIAAVPVALTKAAAPAPIRRADIHVGRLYKDSPVGVVGCFAVGVSNGAFWALAPIFAQSLRADASSVALFMSAAIFAGALAQWPIGWLSDHMDRRIVIAAASLAAGISGGALLLAGALPWGATLLAAAGFGFFAFPLYSLSVALTNDFVDQDRFVEAAGGLALVFGAGSVLGPLLGAFAVSTLGELGLFVLTLSAHLPLAAFALYRTSRRAAPTAEERGAFSDAVAVAQTVATIDLNTPPESGGLDAEDPPEVPSNNPSEAPTADAEPLSAEPEGAENR